MVHGDTPRTQCGTCSNLAHALRLSEERYGRVVEAVRDCAVLMLDLNGHVSSWSQAATALTGYSSSSIIGRHFGCLYSREGLGDEWLKDAPRQARTSGAVERAGWCLRQDGSPFWAMSTLATIADEEGSLRGYSLILQDLTAQRELEEKLHHRDEQFRLLVEAVQDTALVLLNPEGAVINWNSGAEELLGYKAEEVLGRHFFCCIPADGQSPSFADQLLQTAQAEGSSQYEGWCSRSDNSRFWAQVRLVPLHNPDGKLYAFAWLTRDLTLEQRLDQLDQVEQRVERFVESYSNQLRNPLAPMQSALAAMESAPPDDPVQERSRQILYRQVNHLVRLLNAMTDVTEASAAAEATNETYAIHGREPLVSFRGSSIEPLPPAGGIESRQMERLRILIVEDLADVAESLDILLNLWGHEVRVVHGGGDALEVAPRFAPDVVLLDIGLPDINGYEVAKRLRDLPALSQTKLIALTGYGRDTDRQRAYDAGLDHHVVKGSSMDELKALLVRSH